ncbi:HK97-gp10 family putative phage morphogenesis protein [Ignatzschineria cameli]|uniref:HK97 gp10 family phage protein n=1 Tax=Ignatzschineria cameli TaxID=2182793 RepID=A0A2U2AQ92_9GAMM|nr:HK97-gp10 family putative phage morphogenesis protein [Ignatzschineria cameli]PWD85804.1 hypothetical protein DC077_07150 [Ignatzschineria cameli]PWD89432.1 hypothetical protein DC079_06775 [Ignatzschineria cameli]PWD90904.1 hypothetical protein DC081_06485 [Ignatzschineria cameli]PWD91692.1 hypothetical protein DC078_06770 [Ignatzschineria cameli]
MSRIIKTRITGIKELKEKLKSVSDDMINKGGRSALRSAANVIRKEAKERAERLDDPNTPERIADNVVVRWDRKTFRKTGNPAFKVGILGGAKKDSKKKGRGGDTFYWRFLEFGTAKMPAKPFMRPAIDTKQKEAIDKFVEAYKKQLDKVLS